MSNHSLNVRYSSARFKRHAVKSKSINNAPPTMRGGIRL